MALSSKEISVRDHSDYKRYQKKLPIFSSNFDCMDTVEIGFPSSVSFNFGRVSRLLSIFEKLIFTVSVKREISCAKLLWSVFSPRMSAFLRGKGIFCIQMQRWFAVFSTVSYFRSPFTFFKITAWVSVKAKICVSLSKTKNGLFRLHKCLMKSTMIASHCLDEGLMHAY